MDRSDWDNELRAAQAKADELGRHSPNIKIGTNAPTAIAQLAAVAAAVKRLQDAQGAESVAQARLSDLQRRGDASAGQLAAAEQRVEKSRRGVAAATIQLAAAQDRNDQAVRKAIVDTENLANASDKTTASFKVGLIPALLAIAPAAVPIAGVAGGALLGLLPIAATVQLGIKGIENQMKAGAVQGTAFAASVTALKSELSTLEQTSTAGLMAGINTALAKSAPLIHMVNEDIGVMAGQIGQVVGSAGPALVQILTDLNPLFQTFTGDLVKGADWLEHWATSSDGVSRFVAYVQAELPAVESLLGRVVVLFAHLAAGAAPFGGALLNDIDAFVGALDKIPVGLWQTAIPLAVSLYAALKVYGGLTAGITAVSNALGLTGEKAVAAALAQKAASLQVEAAVAAEEAGFAASKAAEAESASVAAAAIAESATATQSVLAEGAVAAAAAAASFSTSMAEEATAAQAAAARIAISAQAAADAQAAAAAEGAAASGGLIATLGPAGAAMGALVIGGGLLATMFLHNGAAAQQASENINTLTEAIKSDGDAIGENTRKQVVSTLAQDGALYAAQKLGIGASTLTDAVLGNGDAYQRVTGQLQALNAANADAYVKGEQYDKQVQAIRQHNADLYNQGKLTADQLSKRFNVVQNLNDVLKKQRGITGAAVASDKLQATAMNTAAKSANALADSLTNAQTALLALGQTELAQAATEDAFKEGVLGLTKTVKGNKDALNTNTQAGLANRDALIQLLQQANAVAQAQQKNHVAIPKVTADLVANVQQLEQTAIHAGLSKDAVQALVAQMHLTPKDIRTTFKSNSGVLLGEVATVKARLEDLTSVNWTINMQAVLSGGIANVGGGIKAKAAGGLVTGPGTGTSDSILAMLSNREFVSTAASTGRNQSALEAGNRGATLFAMSNRYSDGGLVMPASVSARPVPAATATAQLVQRGEPNITINQYISNPLPEPVSVTGPAGMRRAAIALGRR